MCAILCLENWYLQKNNFLLCCLQIAWITHIFSYFKHITLQYYQPDFHTTEHAVYHNQTILTFTLLISSCWWVSDIPLRRFIRTSFACSSHLYFICQSNKHQISQNNHSHWNIQLNESLYSVHGIRNTQRPFLAVELSVAAGGFPPAEMLDLAWVFTSDLAYDQTRQNMFNVHCSTCLHSNNIVHSSNSKFHYYIAE